MFGNGKLDNFTLSSKHKQANGTISRLTWKGPAAGLVYSPELRLCFPCRFRQHLASCFCWREQEQLISCVRIRPVSRPPCAYVWTGRRLHKLCPASLDIGYTAVGSVGTADLKPDWLSVARLARLAASTLVMADWMLGWLTLWTESRKANGCRFGLWKSVKLWNF